MPERVHTRFVDDSDAKELVQTSQRSTESKPEALSRKRKRAEKTGTPEKTAKKSSSKESSDYRAPPQTVKSANKPSPASPIEEHPPTNRRPNGREKQTYAEKRAQRNGPHKSLSDRSKELFETRKGLPIWQHKEIIRQGLRGDKDVMLLVGETGSGKSTQVPQFLLNEPWCRGTIAITQPRRVAAVSLARRVAEEMGTPLGSASPASKVGYSVRFDTSVSPSTKIKFLTEGMLLQEMLRDPWLRQYSAVVVDEVHERSVNVDLILGFLRNLINGDKKGRKGKPLKMVVMSATADVEGLFNFFNPAHLQIQSSDKESNSGDGEDTRESKADKILTPDASGLSNGIPKLPAELERLARASKSITICHIEGRQYPVQTSYLREPTQDFVEAALKCIFQIHMREPLPGDILVFLTGQDTVEGLEKLVNDYASTMDTKFPKVMPNPVY
jgi:ATP-dependent RNA helicase DHR2